jgi:ribosome biogenesis GTPase A
MAKARRQLVERLPLVDIVVEVADARVPAASRNPDLTALLKGKEHLLVLNKADLADPVYTRTWLKVLRERGLAVIDFSAKRDGREKLLQYIKERGARAGWRRHGATRVLVAGIPNVGKSAVINRLVGRRSARVGARPGVTRGQQWLRVSAELELLDTPGLLPPKLVSEEIGYKLAAVGAIRPEVLPTEEVALWLADRLLKFKPESLTEAYATDTYEPLEVISCVARRRGLYLPGGRLDLERAAAVLLHEFQEGRLGRITLEVPEEKGVAE